MQAGDVQDRQDEAPKPRARRWRKQDAREALEAQAKSGLSIEAFAKQSGIRANRLRRWQRRLGWRTSKRETGTSRVENRAAAAAGPGAGNGGLHLIPAVAVGAEVTEGAVVVRVDGVVIEIVNTATVAAGWVASLVGGLRRDS